MEYSLYEEALRSMLPVVESIVHFLPSMKRPVSCPVTLSAEVHRGQIDYLV